MESPQLLREIAAKLGAKGVELAAEGVSAHRSPTGRAWKARKKDGGTASSAIAGSFALAVQGQGFTVAASAPWALYHQFGAKKKPGLLRMIVGRVLRKLKVKRVRIDRPKWRLAKRAMLPKRSVPKPWAEPFVAIADASVRGLFPSG